MIAKIFGLSIAAGVIFSSIVMILMGGKWQRVGQAGYAGEKRRQLSGALAVIVNFSKYGRNDMLKVVGYNCLLKWRR